MMSQPYIASYNVADQKNFTCKVSRFIYKYTHIYKCIYPTAASILKCIFIVYYTYSVYIRIYSGCIFRYSFCFWYVFVWMRERVESLSSPSATLIVVWHIYRCCCCWCRNRNRPWCLGENSTNNEYMCVRHVYTYSNIYSSDEEREHTFKYKRNVLTAQLGCSLYLNGMDGCSWVLSIVKDGGGEVSDTKHGISHIYATLIFKYIYRKRKSNQRALSMHDVCVCVQYTLKINDQWTTNNIMSVFAYTNSIYINRGVYDIAILVKF